MSKVKYFSMGIVAILLLAGGSYLVWHGRRQNRLNQQPAGQQGAYADQPLSETIDPSSIPLNSAQPPKNNNGLSVAPSSSANNLGQLTPNTDSSNSKPSASSSSAAKTLDPTTFVQYDKYKDAGTALFGEIQPGGGDELTAGKKAAVYYKGWLTDGRLFDMSRPDKDGNTQPFVFTLGAHEVIPGWEEGLAGMKVGGTRLLIVPPAVGYGAAGQGPIPPGAVLVFQVQLVALQ